MITVIVADNGQIQIDNPDDNESRCSDDDLMMRAVLVALGVADPQLIKDADNSDNGIKVILPPTRHKVGGG